MLYFLRFFIYLFFRERGREGEREEEKHWCARDTLIRCLLHAPSQRPGRNPGMCPESQTSDLLVKRPALNPLSHTSQGKDFYFFLFREGKGGRKRRRRTSMCMQPGTWPATQACALNGNQTCKLLARSPDLSPLSHCSLFLMHPWHSC